MNRDNILAVADAIENSTLAQRHRKADRIGFNMENFVLRAYRGVDDKTGHACGTVACIAGWAVALFDENGEPREKPLSPKDLKGLAAQDITEQAGKTLGLKFKVSEDLFMAWSSPLDLGDITAEHAVKTLRHLARTGKVNWEIKKAKRIAA